MSAVKLELRGAMGGPRELRCAAMPRLSSFITLLLFLSLHPCAHALSLSLDEGSLPLSDSDPLSSTSKKLPGSTLQIDRPHPPFLAAASSRKHFTSSLGDNAESVDDVAGNRTASSLGQMDLIGWRATNVEDRMLKTPQKKEFFSEIKEKVWPPFEPNVRVVASSFISFLGAAMANSGGVGGGGLFVPMFNLLLGYDTKTSAALSKSMIMGGAIASVVFNVQLKHPTKEAALINFDVARLMQPMLLLGISIGVLFNVMFPPWAITAMLCILLLIMTAKTLEKAAATRRKELTAAAAAYVMAQESQDPIAPPPNQTSALSAPLLVPRNPSGTQSARSVSFAHSLSRSLPRRLVPPYDYEASGEAAEDLDDEDDLSVSEGGLSGTSTPRGAVNRTPSMMRKYLIGEPREVPIHELVDWWALAGLVFVWVVFLAVQITKSHVETCGSIYWILTLSQIPVSVVATGLAAVHLHKQHQKKLKNEGQEGGYSLDEDDDEARWELEQVLIYPLYALIAGVMGGMLGIGGGMVMGPVLLELNLKPQVTAATSTFIVVFSSSLSVVEFYLLGRIPLNVALYFCVIAVVAAFVGLSVVRAYVIRSGKASVIIFLLGSIIGVSGVLLGTLGTRKIYNDWKAGIEEFGFRSPCTE